MTPFTGTTMPKGLSLYAKREWKSYTVTFKNDEMDYESQTVIYGKTAKQPVRPPLKEEFLFDGWYTTSDGDEKYDFNAPVTSDTVIYAKWTPITDTTYTVVYITSEGDTVTQSKNGTGNVGEVIQEFAVKPQGKFFDYTVDEAEKTLELTADASQNIITFIYIRVREMYYTIEYRDMETNQLIYSRENIPSEANHLVVYPSEEDWKALDAVGYELVDHHIEANLTVEGDNIVTFKCKKGEYTITYTGDSDATYPEGMNPTSYTYGDTIRLHNPQKTGYAFNGWKFISEGGEISGAVHDGMNTVIEATSHGNLDFEATWLELAYTVNYDAAGGTPVPAAKTDVGWNQSALLPTETPIRSGYKLVGWTYKGTMITADMKYAELAGEDTVMSITLTAQWTEDVNQKVQITYEAQPMEGGNVTNKADMIQIVTAQGMNGSEAKEENGYVFIGWFKENQLVTTNAMLDKETALGFLEKKEDNTYAPTTFTAKFAIDETKTKELNATVDYMLAKDVQTDDRIELKRTVQVLQPNILSTTGVTEKNYSGWKLDQITVNGETVEKLPEKVEDGATVIYHYIADFTDLDAVGFEEFYNGQPWQINVMGALDSDVIHYYKIDAQTAKVGEEIQNSFINVSDSTAVLVEVMRGSNEEIWTKTVDATVKCVDVELTADSGKKVYDSAPLEIFTYTITAGAFVSDEGLEEVTVEGSQTYVGSSDSEITAYTFKDGTLGENYNIICKPGTLTVTDEGVNPKDVMTKTHEDKTYGLGDVIVFTIKVKNIYDKPCDITINEQSGVKITGESKFIAVEPGKEVHTTAVYTVTEEDLLAGEFTNTVTATIGEKIHRATDTTDKFEKPNSHLTLNKKTTSTPKDGVAYTLGETITYAVTAVNDGNLTLKNVTVTDELTGDTWKIETLAPGDSRTFEAKYVVKEADMKNGTVKNVATATVETPNPKHPITIIVPGQTEDPIATEKVIPKDENPSKPHKNESPNTGDETDIVRWLLLTMVAAGVLLLSIVSRKRRRS